MTYTFTKLERPKRPFGLSNAGYTGLFLPAPKNGKDAPVAYISGGLGKLITEKGFGRYLEVFYDAAEKSILLKPSTQETSDSIGTSAKTGSGSGARGISAKVFLNVGVTPGRYLYKEDFEGGVVLTLSTPTI